MCHKNAFSNNVGQACLSLGYVDKAKPLLLSRKRFNSQNKISQALALIAQKQGDNTLCGISGKAIAMAVLLQHKPA
ncbi:hypothetical protein [Pedobacter steynii]